MPKRVAIVGAGPGGLAAGMLLAARGLEVDIYEATDRVGGRNACLEQDGFRFDLGPTFLLMKDVLEGIFQQCNADLAAEVHLQEVDPLYRLVLPDGRDFFPTRQMEPMRREIERVFPGWGDAYARYRQAESAKGAAILPCLEVPYDSWTSLFSRRFLRALPHLDAHRSVFSCLGRHFGPEELRLAFTFQAKYLGMSPWQAPGTFTILAALEHERGVFHVTGGLNRLSQAMARVFARHGGRLHLQRPVRRILTQARRATGLELCDGQRVEADAVVINADFAHAMTHLLPETDRPHYRDEPLRRRAYSCSTFMLYLGVEGRYDTPHHNVIFSPEYRANVDEVMRGDGLTTTPSFYVQNPIGLDATLAPAGCSTLYVLVPVPNLAREHDWAAEGPRLRERVLDLMETRGGYPGLRARIRTECCRTPVDWREQHRVFHGAVFNLAHTLGQMLHLRPHNRFEDLTSCYLVGGGTHPGSGLPTIYQSARISSDLLLQDLA